MLKELRFKERSGTLFARSGLLLALFFDEEFSKVAPAIEQCLDEWMAFIPDGVLAWSLAGASADEFKPLSARRLTTCRSQLDSQKATRRSLSYFELVGPQMWAPDYSFIAKGRKDVRPGSKKLNLVQISFPEAVLEEPGRPEFVRHLLSLAEKIPFQSGYAAPALIPGADSDLSKARAVLAPLGLRHHGYDLARNDASSIDLGGKCRGARWITFLGEPLIGELGGIETLRAKLGEGPEIETVGSGIAIIASEDPEVGDVNRNDRVESLRKVAAAIEPVTLFGDNLLNNAFEDVDDRERWERRFWW
jgi:hypothetical protein